MSKRQTSYSLLSLPLVVFFFSLLPFLPALRNGFVNWDDVANLVENTSYRGLGWIQLKWMFTTLFPPPYQPLSWLTFGIDYSLWGLDPRGFHLTNLLLHAANAVVFFFLGAHILAAARGVEADDGEIRRAAALSALLFSVHPLRVESVAWATERRDVLSGLFYLLTIHSYLRLGREPATPRRLIAPLAFYLLSLMAKGMGITLPLTLLILDIYPYRRLSADPREWFSPRARSILLEKIPFFVLAVLFAAVGFVSQKQSGAVALISVVGPTARIFQSLYGLSFYVWKTFVPIDLSPLYLRPVPLVATAPMFLVGTAFACAMTTAAVLVRRRWPAASAAVAYYAVTLLPVLGLIPLGLQLVADRYSYLACLPWPLLITGTILNRRESQRRSAFQGIAAVILIFGAMTWRQTSLWHDSTGLWRHAIAIDDSNYVAHRHLGISLLAEGKPADAIEECEKALRLAPSYADGHSFLGQLLMGQGRVAEAADQYSAVLRLKPDDDSAHYNLGLAFYQLGRWQEAIPQFRRAIEIAPQRIDARINLGAAFVAGKEIGQAMDVYNEVLRLEPNNADAHNSLGVVLAAIGQIEKGLAEIDQAIALRPGDAKFVANRTMLLQHLKKHTASR